MLQLNNVEVVYDRTILVLRGVSLEVPTGQIVALLGSNGAGKSTTLKTISGILRPQRGEVTAGAVEFDGLRIDQWEPADIVKRGIAQVMEGRRVFASIEAAAVRATQKAQTMTSAVDSALREAGTRTSGWVSASSVGAPAPLHRPRGPGRAIPRSSKVEPRQRSGVSCWFGEKK